MKNFQDNAAMTATEIANENISENTSKGSKKGNGTKKRPPVPAMWQILKKAQKTFTAQLEKNNENKLHCIVMYQRADMNDAARFWGEFMKQVDRLMDSRKFLRECNVLGYEAINVAEHIVFLGSGKVNRVLKNGIHTTLGNDLYLYSARLSPKEADVFRERIETTLSNEQVA